MRPLKTSAATKRRHPTLRATQPADEHRLPELNRSAIITEVCRCLEAADTPPTLKELAQRAGLSPWQLHRLFVAETGLTPRAYAVGVRARRLREHLAGDDRSITQAIYEAGFNASSRFYESSGRLLGMRARDYRAGGAGARIQFAIGECFLGAILVAESARGICAILLGDDPEELMRGFQKQFPTADLTPGDESFEQRVSQVVGFVEAPWLGLDLPLDIRGTAFQERVWQALLAVPAGSTISYTELAQRVGSPAAVRAVASACGANRLAVAIPCHRVVRRTGDLAGYRWGVERKQRLLAKEQQREDPDSAAAQGHPVAGRIITDT